MIPRLCYITDGERGSARRPLPAVVAAAVDGGLRMVVVRELALAEAELRSLIGSVAPLRARGLRVLVSRRVDLVRELGLDGVHLARDAAPVADARKLLGPDAIIGYSAHEGAEARSAAEAGASYVTLSPIYPTESKPGAPARGTGWLTQAVQGLGIPALALGGITPERTRAVCAAGAWGVATVSSLGGAPDVTAAARAFSAALAEPPEVEKTKKETLGERP